MHKLGFMKLQVRVYVCVAKTSCKAQLENIPQNVCTMHVLPAISTPLSVGHVL